MGSQTIPDRNTGETAVKAFWNIFRDVMNLTLVPRNSAGVATDQAGALGTSTLRFGDAYLKKIFLGTIASGLEIEEVAARMHFNAAAAGEFRHLIDAAEYFRITESLQKSNVKTGGSYEWLINAAAAIRYDATLGLDVVKYKDDNINIGAMKNAVNGGTTAGEGEIMVTSSSGSFTSTSGSDDPVTNLSGTLVCTGRPVFIHLRSDSTTGDLASCKVNIDSGSRGEIKLKIDGVVAAAYQLSDTGSFHPGSAYNIKAPVTAGTKTFTCDVVRNFGGGTISVTDCILSVSEG